ncbi:MAG: 3-phosphoshikimate 1-carboxyvinyltransferase [Phycisphaerae bacterium]|nr:3-phosphoshikimate 1-carboxyvinyltransferase [Phycisphaerae bacterium]
MATVQITPRDKPYDATVQLPGSKSITNRALVMAALASGASRLSNFNWCEDTQRMMAGLRALGVRIEEEPGRHEVRVWGCGGHWPNTTAPLECGDSGTMLRFMSALCATATGEYQLRGSTRLHQRPIAPLIDVLRRLGVVIECTEQEGFAPLLIRGRGWRGGEVSIDGTQSSQFVSALLLAAPFARQDLFLTVTGTAVSTPYIRLTVQLMAEFGVDLVTEDFRRIIIPALQNYQARDFTIEADASAASYFLAAATIVGGGVTLPQLSVTDHESANWATPLGQGDIQFARILTQMGCTIETTAEGVTCRRSREQSLSGGQWDLADIPDVAPTLAVVALFADGPTRISGVAHLRHKESDRIGDLARELRLLGAEISEHEDGLTIHPPRQWRTSRLNAQGDHRLAMAFALVGLGVAGIEINGADCVTKSFPDYFSVLKNMF